MQQQMPTDFRSRVLRGLGSSTGRAATGVICLLLAIFIAFSYFQAQKPILLVFAVGIFAIAINEGVQAYRHRGER
jgi:uncharacterized membrane protein HdeD (DUF308 family)